jgi:phage shock protein PspC (stress-responsive transcriptional regulator)
MYCYNCGRELEDQALYCSMCGKPRAFSRATEELHDPRPLSRIREGKRIAGVCGGVARYLNLDATLVRIVWILVTIFPPVPGLVAYIVCWIAMPQDPPSVAATPNSAHLSETAHS